MAAKKHAGFLQSAKAFVHAILHKFIGGDETANNTHAIIDKGFAIAEEFHAGKLDPAIEETAREFLHGLLANQHVLNLTDDQIAALVKQAIALAETFHKKE